MPKPPHPKAVPAVPPDTSASIVSLNLYNGPLPPASEFAAYEHARPGAADRILGMAEAEQKDRIRQSRVQQFSDLAIDLLSQLFLYGLVLSAVFLAMNDKPLEALFAGIGPVVIAIYANIRRKSSTES